MFIFSIFEQKLLPRNCKKGQFCHIFGLANVVHFDFVEIKIFFPFELDNQILAFHRFLATDALDSTTFFCWPLVKSTKLILRCLALLAHWFVSNSHHDITESFNFICQPVHVIYDPVGDLDLADFNVIIEFHLEPRLLLFLGMEKTRMFAILVKLAINCQEGTKAFLIVVIDCRRGHVLNLFSGNSAFFRCCCCSCCSCCCCCCRH